MKKILLILLLNFYLFSCFSQKKTSDIIYFLPSSVTEILNQEIQKRGINNKVYIVLDKENVDTYVLYLNSLSNSSESFWIDNSNRSVFVDKNLVPLYFYTDEYFSFAEKGEIVLKKLGTEESIKKIIAIRENTFSIKFKANGEVIK
ncbi:hypothetical protein PG593_03810 [Riemerella anatipestifer]|uniref:hypothetical protein n=1 Tax=Riemerella anatipestifer TaxID=34085 RepID=UPI0013753401|nr:hypothetical protein [Riemerella anatipestifer]MBO4232704.1 hypothetical protein [Riemerella anatipestifer]MDY3344197.1 hypothetical protein [Riemerella anatipestifer]MDY3357277.1 hypothetical protein [Riemerella anatipestifer]MDY3528905.1 hypothetical protein [Riemerella anatipestifer]